ncbi:D-2-hydroxyacid dehydrogenase, partial [Kocuria sp. p3-SID1433]|uniref:D-2-hydroxyacid dehydrogenase n=1 Tax=unclassified Kocuria TaxID=2649579 RepID=UPI0021A65F2F|nr:MULTISPECIES: D-2-hydroxyacid dehydrogenase [unclassified Kocuria]MCT1601929.1 D-2-hydroxyacid dehydrogenase [Kocuria sp. p3-SID1428]MCT2181154.1 D-2-hydroxyacid dehydrogenase [Kocuria sp. p3-SID1433]
MSTATLSPQPEFRPRLVVLTTESTPPPSGAARFEELAEVTWTDAEGLPQAIVGAQILLVWDFFSGALREAWPHADALEWVHVAAAGVDSLLFDELRDSPVTVTNAHGAFDTPIAEFVLASILAQDKQLHRSERLQRERTWQHRETALSAGRRVLVIGTGGIGRATARLLKAVGMEVMGAGRTARQDPDFGTIIASDELAEHVGWADHVVVIAPLTEQTRGLVGPAVLERMKPTAHLVNAGRGALVDEPALIEALQQGQIAAASLDVVSQEPLPRDSPLWDMDEVHLSAHMSGDVVGWRDTLSKQFERNLEARLAGRPLANEVDKHKGYVRG